MSARPKYAWENKSVTAFGVVQNYTRVRNTTDGTTVTVRWGQVPAHGNLLICVLMLHDANGAPNPSAGWTMLASSGDDANTQMYEVVYYKYASVGEPQISIPESNGRDLWAACAWEVSGVSGVIASDVKATYLNAELAVFANATVSPQNTTSFNTAANKELVLMGLTGNAGGVSLLASNKGSPDSAAISDPNSNVLARSYHDVQSNAGTAWQASISWTATSSVEYGIIELAH